MVSCLISAYYAKPFIRDRLVNLRGHERIVVCQTGSPEEEVAHYQKAEIIITTPDIPTIGKAWNLAYKAATQKYVTTANTDDTFYPGALDRCTDILDRYKNVGLVFFRVDVKNGDNHPRPWDRIKGESGIMANPEIIKERCIVGPMPVWRRSYLEKLGGFDEELIVAADWEYWIRMLEAGIHFYYIADSLGCYHKRDDSLEWRNKGKLPQEHKRIRELHP